MPDGRSLAGAGVVVGLLDTGIDTVAASIGCQLSDYRYFSASGFSAARAEPSDRNGHGTKIAKLIAGQETGIAPAARLCVGAVIEDGNILARLLMGLDWLAGCGVSVICLPLGLPCGFGVLTPAIEALARADILVVAAIGNGGAGKFLSPGDHPGVLTVGAANEDGRVAAYSGSVNAPDGRCLKPDVVAMTGCSGQEANVFEGTSAVAGRVAGIAAVLRSIAPDATAGQIRWAIEETASPPQADQRHRVRRGFIRPDDASTLLLRGPDASHPLPVPQDRPVPGMAAVDKRLATRLASASDKSLHEVVMAFADRAAMDAALAPHEVAAKRDTRIVRLALAPVCIARLTALAIRAILDSRVLVAAAAADANRGFALEPWNI